MGTLASNVILNRETMILTSNITVTQHVQNINGERTVGNAILCAVHVLVLTNITVILVMIMIMISIYSAQDALKNAEMLKIWVFTSVTTGT